MFPRNYLHLAEMNTIIRKIELIPVGDKIYDRLSFRPHNPQLNLAKPSHHVETSVLNFVTLLTTVITLVLDSTGGFSGGGSSPVFIKCSSTGGFVTSGFNSVDSTGGFVTSVRQLVDSTRCSLSVRHA